MPPLPPARGEVLHPHLLERTVDADVRVVRIVAADLAAVRPHAVAGIGHVRIDVLLRPVLRDRVAAELPAVRAEPRGPADGRDGDHRPRAAAFRIGDEAVGDLAGDAALFADALEEPVGGAVGSVELPVVARGGVAAGAVERDVELGELLRGGEGDAVDVRIDRMPIRGGIDADRDCEREEKWDHERTHSDPKLRRPASSDRSVRGI